MRRSTKIAAAAVMLAMPLAACSSSGPGKSTDDNSSSSPRAKVKSSGMDATAKGPAPKIDGAKKGGTLSISESGVPPTFDPSGAYYIFSMATLSQLTTRSLTGYQVVDGKATLVPDLAQGLGKESADGLTWTFKLKPGMKYSNGKEIKAADFVYAVKRSFAQESVAANGPTYAADYLKGGADYKGPFKDKGKDFPGVTAKGDDTVVFHLTRKWPTLPYYLSFPQASPIPESADTKASYQKNPLAEGPYMVSSFTKGKRFSLKKNPHWDADSDPIRHQFPDKIDVTLGVTALTQQQRILSNTGAGATTIDVSGVDASLVPQVQGAKKNQFLAGASPCESYMPFNTQKIPLPVRKAIAVAYPYDQIRKAAGDSSISFDPATTYAPPQIPGIEQYKPVNGLTGKGSGDPAKAKKMLEKAGKSGFELSYFFANDKPELIASNNALKSGLTKAGFKVKDVAVSTEQISEKINDESASENMGQGINSWCYDWPSGDSLYPQLFLSSNAKQGRSVGNMQNKALDAEIKRIGAMDPTKAGPEWAKLDQKIATKYLPGLPLSYSKSSYVFGNKVGGVTNDPNRGLPDFAQIWVK